MKITSIQTSNFLGARAVDVKLITPITLFAGKNFSGKSSLQEAVRMALIGESVRVGLKKEYGALITEGHDSGFAEVAVDGRDSLTAYTIVLPSGKGDHADIPALPYVLDAQRFALMDANQRRSFLFGLMNIKLGGKDVEERMRARGCNDEKASSIAPLLRAGFDAAHKEAQSRARDDKSAWRTVTGSETYGEKKAATFKMPKMEVDLASLDQARADLEAIEKEIEVSSQNLGIIQSRIRQAESQNEKLGTLRQQAGQYARIKDNLQRDEDELKQWEAKVEETRLKAGVKREHIELQTCPHCGGMLRLNKGNIEEYNEETPPHYDAESAAKLPEYEKSLSVLQNAVENGKRDLTNADVAAQALAGIIDEHADLPDQDSVAELRKKIDDLKHSKGNHASAIRMLEEAARKSKEADEATAKAAGMHQSVQEWEQIAAALAPDGIPAEMLKDALGPINARMQQSGADTGWIYTVINPDMTIMHGRDYALCSESEKWRADAMIAEAIAHLSGIKLLVLDRFDVLDLQGRADLIAWLDVLAQNGEIDTALIFGTLKAIPAGLPETVQAFWIEGGVVGQMKEAA